MFELIAQILCAVEIAKTPQNVGFFLAGIGRIKKVPAIIGETKL